eukprot:CAMPEP_0198731720 /NCGR_PEP_ID=MMETSP1475-20131203/31696_1 /TAXON_ID= ORGANISM="Unidentified sp., Strain CCMP1999" /NCGR_SAMPLE_ID=MMETSP1475 /ASSEMBLY_ACC=CAM_ASM_001111 /LENGTH=150 /DNA_ID=CAMNT_0044494721 /DNA_START=161 /DNA_END=613 /DNA_ORIENTATION=-
MACWMSMKDPTGRSLTALDATAALIVLGPESLPRLTMAWMLCLERSSSSSSWRARRISSVKFILPLVPSVSSGASSARCTLRCSSLYMTSSCSVGGTFAFLASGNCIGARTKAFSVTVSILRLWSERLFASSVSAPLDAPSSLTPDMHLQ